ncbi:claspin [Orussus abietinus]|uniref:claspin n=1 Tax=Orussus abietinus TaxID=222816 RepID=UPI0006252241|nr:claspin [Orussus abietinus]
MTLEEDNEDKSEVIGEDDEELQKSKNRIKFNALVDSDSESERNSLITNEVPVINSPEKSPKDNTAKKKTNRKKFIFADSSSEDENEVNLFKNSSVDDDAKKSSTHETEKTDKERISFNKLSTLIDSDTEEENDSRFLNHSPTNESKPVREKKKKSVKAKVPMKFTTLVDTDSDGENNSQGHLHINNDIESGTKGKKEKGVKKRTGSIRASKDEAMKQIRSETQRLLRESQVSLPYHIPKQRSLEEFLKRKKIAPLIPNALTTIAKIRMSADVVGKILEEKEREAELFFKSSDSEDEEPLLSNEAKNCTTSEISTLKGSDATGAEVINVEVDHHIVEDNEKERAHDKDTIAQQNLISSATSEINDKECDRIQEDLNRKSKAGHKDAASISRKLFVEDSMDIDVYSNVDTPKEDSECTGTVDKEILNLNSADCAADDEHKSTNKNCDKSSTRVNTENDTDFILRMSEDPLGDLEHNKLSSDINVTTMSTRDSVDIEGTSKTQESIQDLDIADESCVQGLPPPEFEEEKRSAALNFKKKVLSNVTLNVKPLLRGMSGMNIDFSDNMKPNKEGVNKLLDRYFTRHVVNTKVCPNDVEVSVLSTEKTAEGVKVVKEILPYKLTQDVVNNDPELSKPGVKLVRLKEELKQKMVQKRDEEWKQKEKLEKAKREENVEEDEVDLEEEEIEEVNISSEEGESEPEEDDVLVRKKKPKADCPFLDKEAEVSEDETDEEDEHEDEEAEENSENEDDGQEDVLNDDEEHTPKKLNRVKVLDEDSNTTNDKYEDELSKGNKSIFRRRTDVDMFDGNDAWMSDDTQIPAAQPQEQDMGSENCKTPNSFEKKDFFSFISPATQLSCLNMEHRSFNTYSGEADRSSVENTPAEKKSQANSSFEKRLGLQKKLFEEPSQDVNDEEILELCSGKFSTQNDVKNIPGLTGQSSVPECNSELQALCSGVFNTQPVDMKKLEEKDTQIDDTSQDMRLTLEEDSQSSIANKEPPTEKPKIYAANLTIASSSSEGEDIFSDEEGARAKKKRIFQKKKVKKLDMSDEEEESDSEEESEVEEENEEDEKYIDYDSEENELVVVPKKDIKKVAADFLENEAELSESEWESADEDEKGLDKFEFEEADAEEIDENQMRDQLGRIHMKQVLDEDQRDVRLLKELLFEDGELFSEGGGRERKFKWKNIDKILSEENNVQQTNDDDGDLDEESEFEWRKLRYEREKFLEERKSATNEIEELMDDSQVLQMGMKVLEKERKSRSEKDFTSNNVPKIAEAIMPRTLTDLLGGPLADKTISIRRTALQRASFLARGQESLAKLAALVKNTEEVTINGPQNTRNFAFAHLSPATEPEIKEDETIGDLPSKNGKRKAGNDDTPRHAKKVKTDSDRSKGKKLF